jgi:hypothetical protein
VPTYFPLAAVPWWAFLMMPLMMLGMALMMWLMMRMMMGMDHGSHDGAGRADPELSPGAGESEVDELRRHVTELQERLAAMESQAPRSEERGEP